MSDAHPFVRQPQTGDAPMIEVTPESSGPYDGADGDHRPGPPSRRRLIGLAVAAAVGLTGAAVLGGYGWRVAHQKDPVLDTPVQLAGLTRDESDRANGTVDYLRGALAADIELEETIGAAYSDPAAADRNVLLFGGTTLIWQPERDLDKLFELLSEDAGRITGVRDVAAGPLGGVMKCGTMAAEGAGELAVCGWADHGSVVMALFKGRGVDESARLFREVRAGVQTRD
jgi:hypothetical protein